MMKDDHWWHDFSGKELAQGEYIGDCPVPVIPSSFDPFPDSESDIMIEDRNIIVITQSCDLSNNKAPFVAVCPVYTLQEIGDTNSKYKERNGWEEIRRGNIEGFYMLSSFNGPDDNHGSLIVDFHQIYSLPFDFLQKHAEKLGTRKRLSSPYLEHLAQAFARFFMRVGLPSTIKKF